MDMQTCNQYLKALIEKGGYLLKSKREKSKLPNEYTGKLRVKTEARSDVYQWK